MLTWAPRTWARRMLLPPTSRMDKHLRKALLTVSAVRWEPCALPWGQDADWTPVRMTDGAVMSAC